MKALRSPALLRVLTLAIAISGIASLCSVAQEPEPLPGKRTTLTTTVRRVVVDVVVTDGHGHAVKGLSKGDFALKEDGVKQKILSFEPYGFDSAMDYTPPQLPPEPPNTFLNIPTGPEKGPLYVLLYDLVNMDNEDQMASTANEHADQMRGRQQLLHFIDSKPEGSRFAIFVWSDGLHLMQGFTADKAKLREVMDPQKPRRHLPRVYLMGQNMGRGSANATLGVLQEIEAWLDGMPGRKNLIWFSGGFPLQLFPGKDDGPRHTEDVKDTLNLLAQNQIAIYPVDVRGVVYLDFHGQPGLSDDREANVQRAAHQGPAGGSAGGLPPPPSGPHGEGMQQGSSLLMGSYNTEDEIAEVTGGHAFYSNNDVAGELQAATDEGSGYYTLTYTPSNHDYDGSIRSIELKLDRPHVLLAYRRSYFGTDKTLTPGASAAGSTTAVANTRSLVSGSVAQRSTRDSLSVSMRHGSPILHQLLFAVQVHTAGAKTLATPDEMTQLAKQSGYFRGSRRSGSPMTLPPVPLQHYYVSFMVPRRQFKDADAKFQLEFAIAAYDDDGRLLQGSVSQGTRQVSGNTPDAASSPFFRVTEDLPVPASATSLRFAVRDTATDRLGATEITLPLAPEPNTPQSTESSPGPSQAPSPSMK